MRLSPPSISTTWPWRNRRSKRSSAASLSRASRKRFGSMKPTATSRRTKRLAALRFLCASYSSPSVTPSTGLISKTNRQDLRTAPGHAPSFEYDWYWYSVLWGALGTGGGGIGGEEARVNRKALSIDLFRHFFHGWEGKNWQQHASSNPQPLFHQLFLTINPSFFIIILIDVL